MVRKTELPKPETHTQTTATYVSDEVPAQSPERTHPPPSDLTDADLPHLVSLGSSQTALMALLLVPTPGHSPFLSC